MVEFSCCDILHKEVYYAERDSGCPLIEIPPHGRLIDADEIKKEIDKIWFADSGNCSDVYAEINDAPTIIPAEGEGE